MNRPQPLLGRVPLHDLPPDLQAMAATSLDVVGEADRLEVFGNHPALYRWYHQNFYEKLFNNGNSDMVVDMRWKELIRVKMSLTHGCFVCNSYNIPSAIAAGFTQDQIDNVLDPTPELFDEAELAVLELGGQIVMQNVDGQLGAELYGRLSAHFSDAEILELGLIAATLTGWTKLMFVFDLVSTEDACPIGHRHDKTASV